MIPRGEMVAALDAVKGAIAQKTFQPILTHVLVENDAVYGYDSEVGIKVTLPTSTGVKFNANFSQFHALMKNLSADDMEITVEGKRVRIVCGKHKSTIQQIVEEEFPKPNVALTEGATWQDVPAGFKEALERAVTSASESEQDRVLSGILVRGNRVYATNRASIVRCTLGTLDVPEMLLSRKAVEEIMRLGNPSRVVVNGPWAVFDYSNLTFLARLREGASEFPPCDMIFDKVGDPEMSPIPDGLGTILTRLRLFSSAVPQVNIVPSVLGCELSASNEKGSAVEYLEAQPGLTGGKGFSPDRLQSVLMYAEAMAWGEPTMPIYLKGEASGFEFVLSPMRLASAV